MCGGVVQSCVLLVYCGNFVSTLGDEVDEKKKNYSDN